MQSAKQSTKQIRKAAAAKKKKRNSWPILIAIIVVALVVVLVVAFNARDTAAAPPPENAEPVSTPAEEKEEATQDKPVIEITMENGGKIVVELDSEAAPITVANFLKLVDENYYDGLTFHRIDPTFMIQGGCPDGTGGGGPSERIKGEFAENGWNNPISHERGVISMARTTDPDSAGSQFFITNRDSQFLDGKYAAFGHVLSGMEVVDEIVEVPTEGERPLTPVVMESIRRV